MGVLSRLLLVEFILGITWTLYSTITIGGPGWPGTIFTIVFGVAFCIMGEFDKGERGI